MSAPPGAHPVLDIAAHHPELAELRHAVVNRRQAEVIAIFQRLDPIGRERGLCLVGKQLGRENFFLDGISSGDHVAMWRSMLAARLIQRAWDARTGYFAEHVSADRFAEFHDLLCKAEQQLIEVTAAEPDNVAAWTLRLMTARGLQMGQAEVRRRYTQAAKADPHDFALQCQMLQQLCPKWGGSWDAVDAFVRDCTSDRPEGAINGTLVVIAHLERWLVQDGIAHLLSHDVLEEIIAAAKGSVFSPQYQFGYWHSYAHAHFAYYFMLIGRHSDALAHFEVLGHEVTDLPWGFQGDAVSQFMKMRDAATRAVRRSR